jgi:isocitrate dehydrogenase
LGQVPSSLIPAVFDKSATAPMQIKLSPVTKSKKELIGVDVFVDWDTDGRNPDVIGES